MRARTRVLGLGAALLGVCQADPTGRTLGSSFGIPGANATYDYVVVGGGNAGLTIASRLVEQSAGSVAVIEAGTFYEIGNSNTSEVPGFASYYIGTDPNDWQPRADWGYVTVPQKGANDLEMHYPRGKMLGGCTARNFMIYQRATVGALDKYVDAVGDDSYSFENMLPWYEKSLNFTPPNPDKRLANATPEYDDSELGTGKGPLDVTYPNFASVFGTWAQKGLKSIGLDVIPGFENGELIGQSYALFTTDATTMRRESSETAFLRDSLDNTALYIYDLTMAKQVLFDSSKRATGVRVNTQGAEYVLSAAKEVIVSAGVIGSPQLLQASGVGPSDLLAQYDIPLVADLPGVGQNFQDHVMSGITHQVNAITASGLQFPEIAAEETELFIADASGSFTSTSIDIIAFEKVPADLLSSSTRKTLDSEYPADWPELEYLTLQAYLGNFSQPTTADPYDGLNYATLIAALVAPQSRGSVNITSADTADYPAIDPAYLTAQTDIDVMVAGFKRVREFWETQTLQDGLDVDPEDEAYPGLDVQTDDEIAASIRGSFQTVYHGSCTCAMGKENDTMAVVDTKARVMGGVSALRVVDASAFALLPPGHPQSLIYALAEKIACDISGSC